jgi:type IV pilus assembly protein PilV
MMMLIKHRKISLRHCANASGGFTLMEVLVTVVILSIGLLGIASLQFNSLRGNQSGLESSVAVALALEGADRMRANTPAVASYDLINAAGADPGCISSSCSDIQVAQTDAFEWISKIEELLPGGEGVICRDSTPTDGTSSAAHGCDLAPATNIFAV